MTFSEFCKQELNYETKTTFWNDFAIADRFGLKAVKDTYERAFNEWKTNIVYLTELALVLNHRAWKHNMEDRDSFNTLYSELYEQVNEWAHDNLNEKDLNYYYHIID